MYLGKLSSFLRCIKCAQVNQNRLNSSLQESCDTVQKCLGLSRAHARALVKTHNLSKVTAENLIENVELLNSLGYTNSEIADHGILLMRRRLQDQYLVLQEAGFNSTKPIILVNFRKLIHRTVKKLKAMSLLSQDCNVVNNLLSHLYPKPASFLFYYNDDDAIAQMHCGIVKKYLQWRLEATPDEIETFFRIYRCMKFKSFQNLCENIDFALSIGFTPRKLLSFGYLLTNNPAYPKTILKEMPTIGGLDMKVAMRRYPKLVTVSPKRFRSIYKFLKEEDVPDETIQETMNIFTLSPKTVKLRFEELKSIPELNALRHSPRILKLIVHHNRTKSRLSFMRELNMKCCSMVLLEYDNKEYFDTRMKTGKDAHLCSEVVLLLKNLLKADAKDIEGALRRHPHHLEVPLVNIEKTVKYLQEEFTNAVIRKVLPIVLYPSEKIQDALEQVYLMENVPTRKLSEIKKLNLALYIMEKSHHFTGNGVWVDTS